MKTQGSCRNAICIGTVLLERNRWKDGKVPTFRVSEWIPRFREAGFDGIELWENHAAMADERELKALETSPLPVLVFGSYVNFDDAAESVSRRATVAGIIRRLNAGGVKFNVGNDRNLLQTYIRNAAKWQKQLPADCRMLCECHGGTLLEKHEAAAAALREWNDPRFQAIVHAFQMSPGDLRSWFGALGAAINHVHVQLSDEGGSFYRLDQRASSVRESLRIMAGEGFRGSFTLEFTEGTRRPDATIEDLYRNAVQDLAFLRQNLP